MGEAEVNPDDEEEPRLESWREPRLERPPNWTEALLGREYIAIYVYLNGMDDIH